MAITQQLQNIQWLNKRFLIAVVYTLKPIRIKNETKA